MAKGVFGAGAFEGIQLGILVKTGIDISGPGIALTIVDALKPFMVGQAFIPVLLIIAVLIIVPWLILISDIQNNGLPFIAGLVAGVLIIVLF